MADIQRDDDLGWLMRTLDRVIDAQRPLVVNHLRELRRKHPELTPEQIVQRLERQYVAAVSAGGAAVGATAVVPGIGTAAALGLTAVETIGFLEASAFFAQAVTEVHGIHVDDPERAKALVMGLMLGSGGKALVRRVAQQTIGRGQAGQAFWGELITSRLPTGSMGQVVDFLRRAFLRRMARNTGTSMLGRALPFGIGAAIGGVGNNILGRQVVKAAREAFGPAPLSFGPELAPRIKEVRPSLGQRIKEARAIEREGLAGGFRRFRERGDEHVDEGTAVDDRHDDGAPPREGDDAPSGRAG
ncbi:hypothetical protein LG314_08600 [Agrococcus terreus]|uniref:hypothetical protein n=1 Tax=Agrococcus terreus TaxID=574649 RepID=UPI00384F9D26